MNKNIIAFAAVFSIIVSTGVSMTTVIATPNIYNVNQNVNVAETETKGYELIYNGAESTATTRVLDVYVTGVKDFFATEVRFTVGDATGIRFEPGILTDASGMATSSGSNIVNGEARVMMNIIDIVNINGERVYFGKVTLTVPSADSTFDANITKIQMTDAEEKEVQFTAEDMVAGSIKVPSYGSIPQPTAKPKDDIIISLEDDTASISIPSLTEDAIAYVAYYNIDGSLINITTKQTEINYSTSIRDTIPENTEMLAVYVWNKQMKQIYNKTEKNIQ